MKVVNEVLCVMQVSEWYFCSEWRDDDPLFAALVVFKVHLDLGVGLALGLGLGLAVVF